MPERVKIVVPGDDPVQIAGSASLGRLGPYGEVTLHTTIPGNSEEKIERVRDAGIIINSRGAETWPGAYTNWAMLAPAAAASR